MNSVDKLYSEAKRNWNNLVEKILTDFTSNETEVKQFRSYLEQLLDNVPHGKQQRAMLSIYMHKCLKKAKSEVGVKDSGTEEAAEDDLAYICGWIIEILQASALIADDLMDSSETRRGTPCWYKQTGSNALYDAMFLGNIAAYLSAEYFLEKDYFNDMVDLLDFNVFCTVLGQGFDLRCSMDNDKFEGVSNNNGYVLDRFTPDNYDMIVKYKTSLYTFYYPLAVSMIRHGIADESVLQQVEDVTVLIGNLFQKQDDYIDCFGDPAITGKIGTDIKDKKCSWCIVKALELANSEQRAELLENYILGTDEAEEKVKAIYKSLKLTNAFRQHEEQIKNETKALIEDFDDKIPKAPFHYALDSIYRRNK